MKAESVSLNSLYLQGNDIDDLGLISLLQLVLVKPSNLHELYFDEYKIRNIASLSTESEREKEISVLNQIYDAAKCSNLQKINFCNV